VFEAPFFLASHDGADDPVLTYGNRCAPELFEMDGVGGDVLAGDPEDVWPVCCGEQGGERERERSRMNTLMVGRVSTEKNREVFPVRSGGNVP